MLLIGCDRSLGANLFCVAWEGLKIELRNKVVVGISNVVARDGDLILIKGNVGAGKSSFIDWLLGFYSLDRCVSGRFEILGQVISSQAFVSQIKNVSFIQSQSPPIFSSDFTDNVTMFGSFPTLDDDLRKPLRRLLPCLDYTEALDVDKLSGGQRKILGVIRALSSKKKILFFDEPCSGLSEEYSRIIVKLIAQYKGICFVVSHGSEFDEVSSSEISVG